MSLSNQTKILILFAVFYLNCHAVAMRQLTITYDEWPHLRYGLQTLSGNTNRFDDSKMPISALNALPLKGDMPIKETVLPAVRLARWATVVTALGLAFLIFFWTRRLYGEKGALLALFLFALEPNLFAHAEMVTTDLYAAAGVTLALMTFWKYSTRPGMVRAIAVGVCLGVAQIAKYSSVYLYPIMILIALIRWGLLGFKMKSLAGGTKHAMFILILSFCVINAGFLFNRSFTRFGDYNFKSSLFTTLQQNVPGLHSIPVPLPYPYVEGLDLVKYGEETGTGFGKTYLFGQIKESGDRFPGYYIWAYLLKTPIALQLLILAAFVLFLTRFRPTFRDREIFLVVPVVFYFIYFNFFCGGQMGIRYLLIFYPLLIVACGALMDPMAFKLPRRSLSILLCYFAISSLSYFPHSMSYFNEILTDRKMAYRYLADSNLDWGQNVTYLTQYLRKHPDSRYNPKQPVYGHIVVDANLLVGVRGDVETYRWLRENFKPTGHVAYSYLIYDVPLTEWAALVKRSA